MDHFKKSESQKTYPGERRKQSDFKPLRSMDSKDRGKGR